MKLFFSGLIGLTIIFTMVAIVPNAFAGLAGIYIYANGGNYYRHYGPSQYWKTTTNEGYCGHLSSCSPNYMEYTYPSCPSAKNYAVWDNIDSAQYGIHKIFVPRVNATSNVAPYSVTYNGASQYNIRLNQYQYSDQWIQTGKFWDIRNTWLTDATCESSSKKIGFDEIQIGY